MNRRPLPDLSRFEIQCLRFLSNRGEATVRDIHDDVLGELPEEKALSYSTVRKIVERLEQKGAVERVKMGGKAWIYRSTIPLSAIIGKEIRRFLDSMFGMSARQLMSHLVDTNELSLSDLRALESELRTTSSRQSRRDTKSSGTGRKASRAKKGRGEE